MKYNNGMLMGASYSFGMDNNRILKSFLRMRNGGILFLIASAISIIPAFMYILHFVDNYYETFVTTMWFFELVIFILITAATVLFIVSITSLIRNVNEKREKLFKLTRVLLIIFLILYVLFSIIALFLHLEESIPIFSLGKNLIAYFFLSAFLLSFSFNFSDLQRIGYSTRLLYVPLIFLSMPSVLSLIFGCIVFTESFSSDIDAVTLYGSFVNLFMTIFLTIAFLELFRVIHRMTKLIDVQYIVKTPELKPKKKSAVLAKK